jgi:hypothetical protein
VHSSTCTTAHIERLVVIVLVLSFCENIKFHSIRSSVCERQAHKEYNPGDKPSMKIKLRVHDTPK